MGARCPQPWPAHARIPESGHAVSEVDKAQDSHKARRD